MGNKYDAKNPPEYVSVMLHKLGRKFILAAQKLPIYEQSCRYTGSVCLVHGVKDKIVPVSYSERYNEEYANSELHILENVDHFMRKGKQQMLDIVTDFMVKHLL